MINTLVNNINAGFGNCIFINKDAKAVSDTIIRAMNDSDGFFPKIPKRIDLVPIDDMHDNMVLDYSDNGTDVISGKVTWGRTNDGNHYLFKGFDETIPFRS
jgi:hypothetical protein